MARVRNVCFTINNYQDADIILLQTESDKVRYIVYGKEEGENGTPHLQGYIEFCNVQRFNAAKKLIGETAHLEKRRGTSTQAAGYCKKGTDLPPSGEGYDYFMTRTMEKPGTWRGAYERGIITEPGARTDITQVVEAITQENATIREVALEFPEQYVKYHKGFRDLRAQMLAPRKLDDMPEVIVLWGPTGTGKTRDAYIKYWPDEPHYVWKPSNGNWWDGYDGEKKIIIDEFRGQMTWSDILGLLDRNEFRAPYKGGFVNIVADKFIFTSPFPPNMWYRDDDRYDRYSQLERRITKVIAYDGLPV